MKLLPSSQFVTLTEYGTSDAINVASSVIQRIDTDPNGSCLSTLALNLSVRNQKVYVTETPAAIATLTGIHVLLTDYVGGLTWYVSALCVRSIADATTYRVVEYNFGGQTLKAKVTQSLAALKLALNAAMNAAKANATTVSAAGGTQGTATPITGSSPLFITVTGGAGGIKLPAATLGSFIYVDSQIGTDLSVYPAVGEYINGGAVNVAYVLQAQGNASFICNIAGQWAQAENSFPVVHTNEIQSIGTTMRITAVGGLTVPDSIRLTTEESGLNYAGAGLMGINVDGADVAIGANIAGDLYLNPQQYFGLNAGSVEAIASPGQPVTTQRVTISVCAVATHGIQLQPAANNLEYTIYADPGVAFPPTVYDDAGVIIGTTIPLGDIATVTPFAGGWKMRIETPV